MHRALSQVDLLLLFFETLSNDGGRNWELLAAALTCKIFSEVALKVLWKHLYGFHRLLRVCKGYKLEKRRRSCYLTNCIDSAEIQRLKKYASYVQELSCNGYIQVHESVYQTLRARGLSPVFPNLRALNWWGSEEELSVLIPKGSRILSLYVSLDPYNPRHIAVRKLQSLLDGLPAYAPDVKQLLLTKIPVDLSLHAISEFKSLNIVRLSSKTRSRKSRQVRPYAYSWVTWDILRAMAPFHRFRKLDIEVSNLFLPSDSAFLEFSELEELKLNGHMANVMAILPRILADKLVSLEMSSIDIGEYKPLPIQDALPLTALKKCRWHIPRAMGYYTGRDLIRRALLSKDLEEMYVHGRNDSIDFYPEDFRAMALAWPRLKNLGLYIPADSVGDYDDEMVTEVPPISILETFARHCPMLEWWNVPVYYDTPLPDVSSIPPNRNMQSLYLTTESEDIETAAEVALFLYTLFPEVGTVDEDAWGGKIHEMILRLQMGVEDWILSGSDSSHSDKDEDHGEITDEEEEGYSDEEVAHGDESATDEDHEDD